MLVLVAGTDHHLPTRFTLRPRPREAEPPGWDGTLIWPNFFRQEMTVTCGTVAAPRKRGFGRHTSVRPMARCWRWLALAGLATKPRWGMACPPPTALSPWALLAAVSITEEKGIAPHAGVGHAAGVKPRVVAAVFNSVTPPTRCSPVVTRQLSRAAWRDGPRHWREV